MRVAITGASGLVGRALSAILRERGDEVLPLVRRTPQSENEIHWNPETGEIERDKLEGLDAVIHLAGENVASGLWTEARKERIRRSRVRGTELIVSTLNSLKNPPRTFISASAIGGYGNRGDEVLNEDSRLGEGFLAEVAVEWEGEAQKINPERTRLVLLRIGIVLSKEGGALKRMLPAFRLGVAGRLGDGKQYISWVSLRDVVSITCFALDSEISGPINVVSPHPVTNAEFTAALGKVLRRPTIIPAPKFLLRLLLGEMADEMLLASMRVIPKRLSEAGYHFQDPNLETTLAQEK